MAQLGGIDRFEDLDLSLFREVGEDLDAGDAVGCPEDAPGFLGGQAVHELGGASGMQGRAELPELGHVVGSEHFTEFGKIERVHGLAAAVRKVVAWGSLSTCPAGWQESILATSLVVCPRIDIFRPWS